MPDFEDYDSRSSSTAQGATTVLEPETEEQPDQQEAATEQADKQLERDCNQIQMQILSLLSDGVQEQYLTERDRKQYMEGITFSALEAGGARDWETKKKWLRDNLNKYAPHFVSEARQMTATFLEDVANAEKQGWISKSSANRWRERLYKRSANWPETKSFLKKFNTKYLSNWRTLHEKKVRLETKVTRLQLTPAQVPELKPLLEVGFDDKHFSERNNAVLTALAAVTVYEANQKKLTALFNRTKSMLSTAVSTGALSKNKVGKWLDSLFNTKRSPDAIEKILDSDLTEYIGNWTKIRYRFDRVERKMNDQGVPPGFVRKTADQFLELDYPQRLSYVEEGERSLKLIESGFSARQIDKLKLQIRSFMAQKDWEGAEASLKEARSMAEGEDVYELNSMENYIRLFREDDAAPPEASADTMAEAARITSDMREALNSAPGSMQKLYITALEAGPTAFASLCTIMYNRVWCWQNGYLDGDSEQKLYQTSSTETQQIVEEGHRQHGLENINLDAVDDREKSKAMRPYEHTWAPTVMHMDASDGGSCVRLVKELKGKEEARDYWTTLVLRNVSYDKHSELVNTINWRLKSGVRKLHAMGFSYRHSGNVQKMS